MYLVYEIIIILTDLLFLSIHNSIYFVIFLHLEALSNGVMAPPNLIQLASAWPRRSFVTTRPFLYSKKWIGLLTFYV